MLRLGLAAYCGRRIRLVVLFCLCLVIGFLLGLLQQQDGNGVNSRITVLNDVRGAARMSLRRTISRELIRRFTVDDTVSVQPFTSAPPSFSPHPDFPYRYLINEPKLCEGKVFILNMVPVARSSFTGRNRIRALWANRNMAAVSSLGMRTVFVLGVREGTAAEQEQRLIEEESRAHHDIIQVDIVDSYRNLTLKTLTIMHWTLTHCPHATWLLKSDEDAFVNPFALKSVLVQHPRASFVCKVKIEPPVCRKRGQYCWQKWVVSTEEYQNDTYPSHCVGPGYVVAPSMAEKLYAVANKTHPFFLEDVYFTGILAQAFQPHYVDFDKRLTEIPPKPLLEKFWNGTVLFGLLTMNEKNVSAISHALWHKILEYNNLGFPTASAVHF